MKLTNKLKSKENKKTNNIVICKLYFRFQILKNIDLIYLVSHSKKKASFSSARVAVVPIESSHRSENRHLTSTRTNTNFTFLFGQHAIISTEKSHII